MAKPLPPRRSSGSPDTASGEAEFQVWGALVAPPFVTAGSETSPSSSPHFSAPPLDGEPVTDPEAEPEAEPVTDPETEPEPVLVPAPPPTAEPTRSTTT